jgi:hypothetical protein
MTITRYALITGRDITVDRVGAFLPANYRVVDADITGLDGDTVIVAGTDNAGWTLDDYVIPRLASGLLWATEVDLDGDPQWSDR